MSAKHALLGLLLNRSAYPYELADRLQARLGPAWAINSGQLYQTISRLAQEGLIEQVDGRSEPRDDRHVFAITDSGRAEFERWFEDETKETRLSRRPLLVKITLAGPDRLRDALKQIDVYELDCARRLTELSQTQEAIPVGGPQVRADHVLLRLSLSADIFQLEGELRWARHAHEMISWLLQREAIWPSAPERADAQSEKARDRQDAREELFGRMAARHLLPVDGQQVPVDEPHEPAKRSPRPGSGDTAS
ncbi:MAG TPA: PadR family transcriptional regulator [Solirubrobacteraceae bacterium]|jgi:DNA-binding PadR family transcriptional regulator|nr:PadR family transcriptional regulator [Solirubrobacteraceae bacterium]